MPGGPLATSRAARVGRTKRKSRGLAGQRYFAVVRAFGFTRVAARQELSRRCVEPCLLLPFLILLVPYRPT
jgi:hypothetical protein